MAALENEFTAPCGELLRGLPRLLAAESHLDWGHTLQRTAPHSVMEPVGHKDLPPQPVTKATLMGRIRFRVAYWLGQGFTSSPLSGLALSSFFSKGLIPNKHLAPVCFQHLLPENPVCHANETHTFYPPQVLLWWTASGCTTFWVTKKLLEILLLLSWKNSCSHLLVFINQFLSLYIYKH